MIQLQLVAGAILTALAAWQVRPIFRAQQEAGGARRGFLGTSDEAEVAAALVRVRRWATGRCSGRSSSPRARPGLARFVGFLVTLVAGGFLLYYTIWFGVLAFLEMWDHGYAPDRGTLVCNDGSHRDSPGFSGP